MVDDVDSIIRAFYSNPKTGREEPLLEDLSAHESRRCSRPRSRTCVTCRGKRALDKTVEEQADVERVLKRSKVAA
jgi:hypothetical protein